MNDKQQFCKQVTILCDTREQQNKHITDYLDKYGIKHQSHKLDFGDYSFKVGDKDFSLQCVIERKANINELWGNVTKDRQRFEKEITAMSAITHSANLIIENCPDMNYLKNYVVPDEIMIAQNRKVKDIGAVVYNTLQSWASSNRYGLKLHYVGEQADTASLMLNLFYFYYRNYRELVKPVSRLKCRH